MYWKKINKSDTDIPQNITVYPKYKPYLREEAKSRCVYCGIHENPMGGYDYFHVEHYKPKSLDKFAHLLIEYHNLFYACAICNRFKGNDWPNDPIGDHSLPAYPDPTDIDYTDLFKVLDNGKIVGNYIASIYMVEKLVLNRPQLIYERKERFIRETYEKALLEEDLLNSILSDVGNEKLKGLIVKYITLLNDIIKMLNKGESISRYAPLDIKRIKP